MKTRNTRLDRLWQEFDYVASIPSRQYNNFLWYERSETDFVRGDEFNFARAEEKDAISESKMKHFSEVYIAKAIRKGASKAAVQVIEDYFKEMSDRQRRCEQLNIAAEPAHLRALQAFAERAYRRPLSNKERDGLTEFYQSLRKQDGLSHQDAVRDVIVSILMSPNFCYRLDLPRKGDGPARPLDDYALASRLSYFLWASMPDHANCSISPRPGNCIGRKFWSRRPNECCATTERAASRSSSPAIGSTSAGSRKSTASIAQSFRRSTTICARRCSRSPCISSSTLPGAMQSFSIFSTAITRSPIPSLATALRNAGTNFGCGRPWSRIDNAGQYGRGGLLPMAVFLTKNSPGLRTSPVKRGNWVVRRILGERIPAAAAECASDPER